jgi:biopolymer transport protein TolR
MAFGGGDENGGGGAISQINVTPLVDVMLVLLIIFMVAAPILQQGVAIDLPEVRAGNLESSERPMVVSIDARGDVYLDDSPYDLAKLATTVGELIARDASRKVFIRADAAVPYGKVMEVMATVRGAGVTQVGLVTEPPSGSS